MGSQFEKIKYLTDNNQIDFNESNDNNQIGEQFSDFENIQFLDGNSENDEFNWSVSKVRSTKNNNIYLMKKIEKYKISDPKLLNIYHEEAKKLIELNIPFVKKYYKFFQDNNYLYMIMEYIDSDLKDFFEANKIYGSNINEDVIWNILLQCSYALKYLHEKDLGNLGIKLNNIFINNEQNIKIGIFHIIEKFDEQYKYSKRDDIYFLGDYLYSLCFYQNENNKQIYSEDLKNFLNSMIEKEKSIITDSTKLYDMVKSIYNKKCLKISSLRAILRCLYSYSSFNEAICQNEEKLKNNTKKYYISYSYLKSIKIFVGENDNKIEDLCSELRIDIIYFNPKIEGIKEMDPFYLLVFLLDKMYKESNLNININNQQKELKNEKYVIDSMFNEESLDKKSKEQMYNKFINNYKRNANSPISDLFCGIVLTETICQRCENITYSFSNFCFIYYDLLKDNKKEYFDLMKDGFENGRNKFLVKNDYCDRCLTYQEHHEYDKYYRMCTQLMIYFYRGNNYKNNTNINFQEEINLDNFVEEKNISNKYYLVGCINRINIKEEEEEFIFYTRDPDNKNIWYINNEVKNLDNAPIDDIQKNGQIIMLFYNKEKN